MKKILYLVLVALLAAAVPTWGQTNRTLGDIPTGWKVQAGSVNFTADENNHEVQIPAGSTVTLTPMYPAKVKSVKLKDVPPTGAIKGEFTVNAGGKKVWFSQGNLQAVCSSADNDASTQETWTWQFAANQWDYIGSAAANTSINGSGSVSVAGTVDLFGWVGTSSYNNNYGIWNNTTANSYGNTKNESLKNDWGHNAIANGGNSADMWRTLTREEWGYMLSTRSGATVNGTNEVRFAKATIRTDETAVKGVILFPDGATFEDSEASWNDLNSGYNNYTTTCTAAQWTALEAKGCVFLPAAGNRTGTTVSDAGNAGAYWTATGSDSKASDTYPNSYGLYFASTSWGNPQYYSQQQKSYGLSVRLVKVVPHAVDLSTLTGDYEAQDGDILINTLAGNYKITIADRATVTLRNATINGTNNNSYQWAGITCLGDATIVLEGTNTVTGFHHYYPGIQAAHNGTGSGDEYTLTIKGDGSLTASSNDYYGDFCAAGIGAGYNHACGNILIESGTIVANGDNFGAGIGGAAHTSCGTITITGGTVTATGGQYGAGVGSGIDGECQSISITGGTVIATGGSGEVSLGGGGAGIGSGTKGSCSTITITDGVTQVTATKGANAPYSIGAGGGSSASCGTVTIGGTEYYNGTNYENEGATYLAQSPLVYPAPAPTVPTGAIDGLFSVSSTKQVYFSQGNLQYTKSTGVWSFMEHQYSTVETNGSPYCTDNYGNKDVVSLFSWATSGYNHGATSYQPYSTNTTNENYYAYGDASYNLYDQTGQADWGYNAISNGGNTVNSDWRTLTTVEWQYLFANHTTGWSSVNGVNGYVIRPDGVSTAIAASYTASDWDTEEAAGAVFLPAAGYRNSYEGTDVYDKGSIGRYWSSSANGSNANYVNFSNSSLGPNYTMNRKYGLSVRLVKNAN